jgi:stage II sporulation protein D
MSQWGAYGYARRGTGYAEILSHYYRGTTLGRAPLSRVRVLLASGRTTATIGSAVPFRVRDGLGVSYDLNVRRVAFGPGLRINVDGTGLTPLTGPLVFTATSAPLELAGKRYRGTFEVAADGGKLRVVNNVGLEQYLWGVVPDEMPHTWPAEALKAQAVVARSYALAVRRTGGAFDLYPDVRSQVYGGVAAEEAPSTTAAAATAGQVLLYGGRVATTFFFSTSGGRTENAEDAWAGGKPVPYLVSVPDPYDTASPHHRWGPITLTGPKLARTFGVRAPVTDLRTTRNRSGRVAQIVAVGGDGRQAALTGSQLRERLGLRSTWFTVSLLRLDAPARPASYASRVQLTGLARGAGPVTIEQRPVGTTEWQAAGRATSTGNGGLAAVVKATAPLDVRLAGATLRTSPVRVLVAPAIRLAASEPTAVHGTVRPALAGATVAVQRRVGTRWTTVTRTRVDAAGGWEAALALVPGTYRARVAPGRGFVAGVSPALVVAGP